MVIRYKLTRSALLDTSRLQFNKIRFFIIVSGTFIFCYFEAPLFDHGRHPRFISEFLIGSLTGSAAALIALAGIFYVALPFRIWRYYRKHKLFYGETELKTDASGLEISVPRGNVRLLWSDIKDIKEDSRIFLIRLSRSVAYPIPKSDTTQDVLNELRSLIVSNLRKNA